MALVNCPECGREKVSDTAEHCPFCGYGLREYFETKRKIEEVTMPEKPEEEPLKRLPGFIPGRRLTGCGRTCSI